MRENDLARRNLLKALTVPAAVALSNSHKFAQSLAGRNVRAGHGSSAKLPARPWPSRGMFWNIDALSQYDIRNYGAVGDDKADDTSAVQNALGAAVVGGGGVVYIPSGIFKVGNLAFPPNPGHHWITVWMDGSLHLTQTLEMNQPAYALVGRSGAVFQSFQRKPSVPLYFDPPLNPVIHITSKPIYLSGLNMGYVYGDGILAEDGSTDLILEGIQIAAQANVDPQWAPLKVVTPRYNFGLYIRDSVFQSASRAGAHSIILTNQSIVSIKDTTLMCGGILLSAPNSAEGSGYDFEHVLYEGGFSSFLTIDNTNGWLTGFNLKFVEMADPSLPGLYLVENSGTGVTDSMNLLFARNDGPAMVGGDRGIGGLNVFPASTTAKGGLDFLGQKDGYAFLDNHGVMNIARVSLGYGGNEITKHLSSIQTLAFPTVPAGGQQELSFTLVGAQQGDSCDASPAKGAETGLTWASYVSEQDTVVVRLVNPTPAPITPSPRAWRVDLWQH